MNAAIINAVVATILVFAVPTAIVFVSASLGNWLARRDIRKMKGN